MTKMKKLLIITILALLALGLGACTGRRVVTSGWSGITVNEETIYLSSGPQVYAVALKNGTQIWQYPPEADAKVNFYAAPVLTADGTQIIISSYNSEIHSVNPENGLKIWSFTIPSSKSGLDIWPFNLLGESKNPVRFIASPLVTAEGIFAPASNNTLYALDLEGGLQWEYQTDDPLWASPIWSENCECIYQVSMDHHLYALNAESGKLIWKSEDLGGPMVSPPAISESGLIIVSTFNNEVIALDESSHDVEWRYATNDWAWASPLIDGEQVYVSDIGNNGDPSTLYALELATGDVLWQIQPGGSIFDAPLVQDDLIYISTDTSSLVVVDQDGVVQRNQPFEGKLYAGPISGGDKLLLAPSEFEYYLIALNQSGIQTWGYPPADN